MEPASLTKLMTAYIVFQKLAAGALKLNEPVLVSEHAWRSEGSRTFIELGKPVTVEFLILGMIVQSGNDATIALAERIAGTEETFAQLMNSNAKRLGMTGTHFENSSGLPSPNHYTTAHDMSLLAIALIRDFPQFYKYFSVREFEYNGIKQQNRNGLLEKDPTVDGLKTGHTDSAGFCLVTSSLRDGMRLVSVVLGSTSMKGRENASAALLNYGFTFYDTKLVVHGGAKLASAPVWKAASTPFDVGIDQDLYITLATQPIGRHQDECGFAAAAHRAARAYRRCRATARNGAGTVPREPARASFGGRGSGRLVAPPDRHHQALVQLMPLPVCYLNGQFLPLADARVSPLDRAFLFGDAVYEVVPVYAGRPFRLREHLDRLVRSLAGIRMEPPLTHAEWDGILHTLIERNGGGDQYVYFQVTRGAELARNHAWPAGLAPTVFAFANPLEPVSAVLLEQGVAAITAEDIRWARRDIKSTALLANTLLKKLAADAGAFETILLERGELTEGSSTTVHVIQGGEIHTPPNGHHILPGTTRDVVTELAARSGIPSASRRVTEGELRAADEIWLAFSTRGVLPVTRLDGKPVGTGKPGPLFERIYAAFVSYVRELAGTPAL